MEQDSRDHHRRASNASSPEGSDSKTSNRSKANIRVSLACVQCRNKHVKCDATLPACKRCQSEGKACFYAKSRRGIRDPKKRSLISDNPPGTTAQSLFTPHNAPCKPAPFKYTDDLPHDWCVDWRLRRPSSSLHQGESLLDVFYSSFHRAHPVLPPQRFLVEYANAQPNDYQFLVSVVKFCASLYVDDVATSELRETAYSAACGALPFTVQTVQGLLLLCIAAFGEMKFEHHTSFVHRALGMAIELGMQRKSFADQAQDRILAESYRRTWWALHTVQYSMRLVSDAPTTPTAEGCESDVDLPCEQWEYDSGVIPPPISRLEYETRASLSHAESSSGALNVELCGIHTELVLPYLGAADEGRPALFDRADSRICDFLRRVPQWKMDLVDPDGMVDTVLFHAVALAHIDRLRLRRSAPRYGLNLREYFPLGPSSGPNRKAQAVKSFGWNPYSPEIQAANSFCDLFRYPFPPRIMRPSLVPGILRVALTYLDACVFLGLDSPALREKLDMLVQILSAHGKIWPLSQKVADEIRAVATEYLPPRMNQGWLSGGVKPYTYEPVANPLVAHSPLPLQPGDMGFGVMYPDMAVMQEWNPNNSWENLALASSHL
ncbi:hypothetical protein F4780DRAFT_94659 [Xylariomycetidae sp. FL0641]|nr:hypothetical protein F4780DRAFT_94659 [Xylariomycetidae sp. FL0641]